jgi:hypothetical protein
MPENNEIPNHALLEKAIASADPAQIDGLWAILKYKEMGIMRKIKSMCCVLGLKYENVDEKLPKDTEGRILDVNTRHMIHKYLISVSKSEKA